MKIKNWYTSEELSELCKISIRTIERRRVKLLSENPDIGWFRTKSKPYKYSFLMMGEFLSPAIFELIKRNRQLANTIGCMHRTGTLEQHLSFIEWDYFITIAYEDSLSKEKCFDLMHKLYEKLEAYSFNATTRMFFTCEPFTNRRGHHNHMILKLDESRPERVADFIKNYIPNARIDVQPYDHELAGVFYVTKNGIREDNWDILGNRLSEEGIALLKNNLID